MKYLFLFLALALSLPAFAFTRERNLACKNAEGHEVLRMFFDTSKSPLGPQKITIMGRSKNSIVMAFGKDETTYQGNTSKNETYSVVINEAKDKFNTSLVIDGKATNITCVSKSKFRFFSAKEDKPSRDDSDRYLRRDKEEQFQSDVEKAKRVVRPL